MTTSTPNSKLYGYLRGFEQACFTGSAKQEVVQSYIELNTAEMSILGIDTSASTSNLIHNLGSFADKFLTEYYGRMRRLQHSSIKIQELADKSKSDAKSLSRLLSILLSGSVNPIEEIAICPVSAGQVKSVINICDGKCPYYLGHKFCVLYDEEGSDEVDFDFIQFYIPEYKFLALAMVKLASFLLTNRIADVKSLINYHMLFEYIVSISRIYELMNPAADLRQQYLDDAEALLTQEPLDTSADTYVQWEQVFDSVLQDIEEGKLRYIQDIKQALDRNRAYTMSKYDAERDAYCSMKGTAQSGYTRCHESLISSCFEVDQYADQFVEFDEYVGFVSRYPVKDESYLNEIPSVRTILINNPGKFKPRIIHIGDNPIQDRCSYIHRRLKRILDSMKCDCTSNQENGRSFLKDLTLEWFITNDSIDKKGIYGFDFSNATDTLDQHFQYRVLEYVFGPEVANFWDKVSKLDKFMSDLRLEETDFPYHKYKQTCGQPQGLLGSFDAFALAHHFIFLMDMKVLGLVNHNAWEFYRVLGDDSVSNSIDPEIDTYDDTQSPVDKEGIRRSLTERVHFDICENFAGFKVNYDKSESIHHCDLEAKLDFAKVTYRNGILFTPVPFRLAMNYSKNANTRLAVAIWRMERGDRNAKAFMDFVLQDLDSEVSIVVKSGCIPFLSGFKEDSLQINESFAARVRYATSLTYLTTALGFCGLSDRDRDKSEEHILDRALKTLFTKKVKRRINDIDPNHKVMLVMERNAEILTILDQIYEFNELDDQYLALACSSLGEDSLNGELFDCLYNLAQTSKILRLAKGNSEVDVSTIFPDFDMKMEKALKHFSEKFITRGLAKRPREEVFMLQNILDTLKQLDDILGSVPRLV
jgi:hypothetical protein